MSPLSTEDQELWFQSQMGMKSDKQRRRNQRQGYSNPSAGVVDGACLKGTGQAPCSSPHLTDKKIKGSRNKTTCPRHQLARDSVCSIDQAIQGLSHAPSLLLVYKRLPLKLSTSQSVSAKFLCFLHPYPCPPPLDCQSLFCTEGDRVGLDKFEMTARLSGFLSDWLLRGEQSLAPALSKTELLCDSQENARSGTTTSSS